MLYVIDLEIEPTRLIRRKRRGCFHGTKNIVNGDVRPDMLQEIAGLQ